MKSSPTVSKAVKEAMERMESGQSDPKPERKPSKPYSLYGGLGYDKVMEMQKAGHGFGNYSGEPRPWNKAKGGKINLKDCSVSTHEKNSKHKHSW
jgi:hypothetical protein